MDHKPVVYKVPGMEAAEVHRDLTYKTADGAGLKMDIYVPHASAAGTASTSWMTTPGPERSLPGL